MTTTAFILVPGLFTGPHVWEATAARLTAAGAEVHTPVLAGPDLEADITAVLAAIDAIDPTSEQQIVLAGHDYGIHPAVGAADRRADRIARIVYVDSGMPQDGVPAVAAVPDQELSRHLTETAGALPPPATGAEWQRWGSTEGVPAAALDRLTALAAEQPVGTLLQPLRLTGAVAAVPTTGVLCTGSGTSIEMLQMLVGLGDPALQALTDPRVSFFELATGHWPMLSRPDELADVLLSAAAGEGHRLKPAAGGEPPTHLRPFLLDVPEVPHERHGNVDLYLPPGADGPLPAIVFVHGGPVPAGAQPSPRDWPTFVGYGRYAAEQGVVGVTLDHRLHDVGDYERAAADVAAAVALVRADPRVDGDRVGLWFFSGGGPMTADWLAAPPEWLRCVAATYPILAPLPNWGLVGDRFRPASVIASAGRLPILLTRVGLEMPEIAATVEEFVAAAKDCGANLEIIEAPHAHHGFETRDVTDESRTVVRQAMRGVLTHLGAV
ncbi:dienelactone hydrolase family protein [Streptomyces sp. NPDC049555]|uniref:alpha/beta hydrolase n=1 Tax=Streptomyces sp. NPDC049555 TaxID=3154930 RepID=UPI003427671A